MSTQTSLDVVLKTKGINCEEAAIDAQQALLKIPGVHQVRVDAGSGEVALQFDPGVSSFDEIMKELEDAGFHAEVIEI
jgi:copper chaperone CopZ